MDKLNLTANDVFDKLSFELQKFGIVGCSGGLLLDKEGVLILEHTLNVNFENHPNFTKQKKYGTTFFSFFKH